MRNYIIKGKPFFQCQRFDFEDSGSYAGFELQVYSPRNFSSDETIRLLFPFTLTDCEAALTSMLEAVRRAKEAARYGEGDKEQATVVRIPRPTMT